MPIEEHFDPTTDKNRLYFDNGVFLDGRTDTLIEHGIYKPDPEVVVTVKERKKVDVKKKKDKALARASKGTKTITTWVKTKSRPPVR